MRLFLSIFISMAIVSNAQDAGSTEPIQATLKAGATAGRLVIPIVVAPAPGDRLVIGTDTNALKITVVTPDGRRINPANADANGFDWSESPDTPRIGTTDGGFHAIVSFKGAGATGDYTVDFASSGLRKQAAVGAWYITDRDQYDQMLKESPGAQRVGPVSFAPSKRIQDLTLSLAADEIGTLIDIVVTDPSTTVRLKLPNGTTLTAQTPKSNDFEWKTAGSRDQADPPGAMFGIGGFLLPRIGTHHVIMLRTAVKGDYGIHLELAGSNPGEAEALLLPIERLLSDATASLNQPPKLPDGTILLQPTALPYNCFVGDRLDLAVRLIGDPAKDPVRFQVKVETRTPLPYKEGAPQEYAPPKVVTTPVMFTKEPGGEYRGVLIPKDRGIMRVSITASGTSAAGKPFRDEAMLTDVTVSPVVATFVLLTERAVDDDGNGRPDRWELTATLDVATPGKYEMRFDLSGDGGGTGGEASATLAVGRRKLTASIPAAQIFERLKEGPYKVVNIQLFRPEGNSFGDFVKGTVPALTTAAYKRDQWDRGQVFGEEKVELRPIRPGKGGKFTAVEVTWQAAIQGGQCGWSGDLDVDGGSLSLLESGEFPKGLSSFTFEFDAAALAKSAKQEGHFSGIVNCGNGDGGAASAFVPVTFDPSQYEPADSKHSYSQLMIRAVIKEGYGGSAELQVERKAPDAVTYRLTDVPAGLTAVLQGSILNVSVHENTAPGRYHVDVEATEGNEKETITVLVDAVPALPPPPLRKYAASAATARGIRPDKDGKFQNLEVLWPVEVPADYCNWRGSIQSDGAPVAAIMGAGMMAKGKGTLSLVFDGRVIGSLEKAGWTFTGLIGCDNTGREPGVSTETKFIVQPSTYAKRAGLTVLSTIQILTFPGSQGLAALYVKSDAADPAVFEFVDLPAGIQPRIEQGRDPGGKSMIATLFLDDTVRPGRYYLPVRVTVGANQGTGDVIVDVIPEQ
jgi:hypothetical protein